MITRARARQAALLELAVMYGRGHRQQHMPGSWINKAACRGASPSTFYPERGLPLVEAKRICRGCSVQPQCLDWAIQEREKFGVWGGLSALERRRIWRDAA